MRDVMRRGFSSISASTSMREAAATMSRNGVSDIVVLDGDGNFMGILAEGDLLRVITPGVDDLAFISDGSLAEAFEMLVENGRHHAGQPIERLVIRNPVVVSPDDPVLHAVTAMIDMNIHGMPVVSDGKVVGTIGRADLCRGLLGEPQSDGRQAAAPS